MNIESLIKERKGTLIDVRGYDEFIGGHVAGSRNIPLQEIPARLDELKKLPAPLILFCASGNRSGQAWSFLSQQDIDCVNAGSWLDVNYMIAQNA
ncbi:MAG: rhodanese-like domain-containing protein [Bacteroidia bacterium]|nr:rhodanese-like domain-containing protein [Bacteroidia bacterium]